MRYLLDTNVCIDVLRGRAEIVARFRDCKPDELCLSAVTVFELVQGVGRAPQTFREMEREKVSTFLACLRVVEFDHECAVLAGEINAHLLNAGTPVGIMDVFIAATALRLKLPVVTSNTRDFQRISSLTTIDWRAAEP